MRRSSILQLVGTNQRKPCTLKMSQHHRLKYYLDNITQKFLWIPWQSTYMGNWHVLHLTYCEAKENGCKAQRLHKQQFPIRYILSHPTFSNVHRQLRKTDSFVISNHNAWMPEMEERVLTRFEAISSTSMQEMTYKISISQPVVWHILHEESMPPSTYKKCNLCL